jgi:hypothetical protein
MSQIKTKNMTIDYTGPKDVDYTGPTAEEQAIMYQKTRDSYQGSDNFLEFMTDNMHTLLGGAGMIPGVGNIFDLADAGLYAYEGDKLGTGLALASAVPGLGLMAGATKLVKGGKDIPVEKLKNMRVLKNTNDPETGFHSMVRRADEEIDQMGKSLANLEGDAPFNIIKSGGDQYIPVVRKFMKHRYPSLPDYQINEARNFMEKELLSDESFNLWVKMRKKAYNIRLANQSKSTVKFNVKTLQPLKVDKPDISREYYEKVMKDRIHNTPIYSVPQREIDKLKDAGVISKSSEEFAGLYSGLHHHIIIPEGTQLNTLRGRTTLPHEIKHSAQFPFSNDMELVYGDQLIDMNRRFRLAKKKLAWDYPHNMPGGIDVDKNTLPPLGRFEGYVRTPEEVSARLTEMRTGILGEHGGYPKRELSEAFHLNAIDAFKDKIWGLGFIPLTTTQRFNKAFGEEE